MPNRRYGSFTSRLSTATSWALAAGLLLLSLSVRAQELPGFKEVQAGMSVEDVEALMGKPVMIGWQYEWNGLYVYFEAGEVAGFALETWDRSAKAPIEISMRLAEVERIMGPPRQVVLIYGPDADRAFVTMEGSRVVRKEVYVPTPMPPR